MCIANKKGERGRIMKLKIVSLLFTLALTLLLTTFVTPIEVQAQPPPNHGPRSEQLLIKYYTDDTQLFAALTAGDIDIDTWELTKAQELNVKTNPDVLLAKVERLGVRSFSFHNNLTVKYYPGIRSHMSDANFRKAIAHLVDKDYYRDVICEGAAVRIDTHVASPAKDWWNWTLCNGVHANGTVFNNYPYPYNTYQANLELNQTGYVYGTEDNPNYDPAYPGSARKWRVYPSGHPQKANQKLDGLVFYCRNDDSLRLAAGLQLYNNLIKSGIPVVLKLASFAECNEQVMLGLNYHIYTGGWSVGRYPLALYSWFHSLYYYSGGPNYHCSIHNGYTECDIWGDKLNEAPTLAEAIYAAKMQQEFVVDKYCISISLWCTLGFYGYRNLLGVVNYFAVGPENAYTYMNAYRADNPEGSYALPIRVGIKGFPNQLNHIYSRWVWETSSFVHMASFLTNNPFEIYRDQAGLAKDWKSATWVDPADGKTKDVITFYLRSDAQWIQPITGTPLGPVDTSFYEFSVWWYYNSPDAWIYAGYKDVHHIEVKNAYEVDVYFNTRSMFNLYGPYGRDLYPPAWKVSPLSSLETRVFVEGINATTPGNLALPIRAIGAPVYIESVLVDGVPQTRYTDFDIVKGYATIKKDLAPGQKITIQYWARGDASGYIPGGKPWQDVHIAYGPWYMTEHQPGAGGWSAYKANRYFYWDTPPLGELDWYWYWDSGSPPRNGNFKVDLYDVTRTTTAFGSTGHLIPTVN